MAKIYNVHEAKSNLSRLLEEVMAGEEVTIARAGQPLVDLKIHEPAITRAYPGFMKHLIQVNEEMSDEELWAPEPFKADLFTDRQTPNAS
jgi:antitoxin (DNA-binding transcriptional repressor) of toxin-antitoxin stability system